MSEPTSASDKTAPPSEDGSLPVPKTVSPSVVNPLD